MNILTGFMRVTLTFKLVSGFNSIKDFPECRSNTNKPLCNSYMQNIDSGRYCSPPGNALVGTVNFMTC